MISCNAVRERINAWLDGELDAALLHEMESHAAECFECAKRIASHRALAVGLLALSEAADRATSVPFNMRMIDSNVDKNASIETRLKINKWSRIAAAILLVASIGILARSWIQPEIVPIAHTESAPTKVSPLLPDNRPARVELVAAGGQSRWAVTEKTADARITLVWAYASIDPRSTDYK